MKAVILYNLLILMITLPAFGGAGSSGGGASIVCRDASGKVTHAELYDLFEGRWRHGYTYVNSNQSELAQIETLLAEFTSSSGHLRYTPIVRLAVVEEIKNITLLPPGFTLNQPGDMGGLFALPVPVGCKIEGAAFHEANGNLFVVRDIFDAFDQTNRIALLFHEALWKLNREYKNTSEETRKLVSTLFAKSFEAQKTLIKSLSESVIDGGYSSIYDWPFVSVLGAGEYPDLRLEVIPLTPNTLEFNFALSCETNQEQVPNELSHETPTLFKSGVQTKTLGDQPCNELHAYIGPKAKSERFSYLVKVFSGNILLHEKVKSATRPDDPFSLSILHPEIEIPRLPTF